MTTVGYGDYTHTIQLKEDLLLRTVFVEYPIVNVNLAITNIFTLVGNIQNIYN